MYPQALMFVALWTLRVLRSKLLVGWAGLLVPAERKRKRERERAREREIERDRTSYTERERERGPNRLGSRQRYR